MNTNDALNIFGLSGEITLEVIKKEYKRLAIKYHPDKNPAGEYMMKLLNEAFNYLKENIDKVNVDQSSESGSYDFGDVLNEILNKTIALNMDGVHIEVCGNWIWLTGNTKPYASLLKKNGGIGYYFSKNKSAWYFRPEEHKSKNWGKSFSLDEIRVMHGSDGVKKGNKRLISC
ncbi:J domain-containing protein [Dickeya dadantii]|uniref:J domain-containing protein n=1 Tax=Dickeya dadantii TaxID=204038 RepID=UPI0014957649|nr:J domain-containing protein [Dickeya dadantii]NPE56592.1 J domain-containing protein [Dickeya dadantii]NPE69038.1 J domain-containing protein [Dickeya dadantii]